MDIRLINLSKSYGNKRVLSKIDLTFPNGALSAVLGPSGCGKTTMMRCLAGFLTPNQGVIQFGEEDVTHLPPQKRETAMVFQNYALWPHMTVYENIAYGLKLRKIPRRQIEQKIFDILDKVEIEKNDTRKRYPSQYSGGQQQRIALARALVLEPKLLLMDEPLSNLDAKVRQRLRMKIRRIQKDFGITTVYVTHDQDEAFSLADQVVLMHEGQIEQVGTPEKLYHQPQSFFAAQFLGNSNSLDVEYQNGTFYIEDQIIPLPQNHYAKPTGRFSLVIRGKDAIISEREYLGEEWISLQGYLHESLFICSGFRHWVKVGRQDLFIESEESLLSKGACYIHIPKEKCYLFEKQQAV